MYYRTHDNENECADDDDSPHHIRFGTEHILKLHYDLQCDVLSPFLQKTLACGIGLFYQYPLYPAQFPDLLWRDPYS